MLLGWLNLYLLNVIVYYSIKIGYICIMLYESFIISLSWIVYYVHYKAIAVHLSQPSSGGTMRFDGLSNFHLTVAIVTQVNMSR